MVAISKVRTIGPQVGSQQGGGQSFQSSGWLLGMKFPEGKLHNKPPWCLLKVVAYLTTRVRD